MHFLVTRCSLVNG